MVNFSFKICARVSSLIKLQASGMPHSLKKRPWHKCFPVNFVKLLRTPLVAASAYYILDNVKEKYFAKPYFNFSKHMENRISPKTDAHKKKLKFLE